MSFRSLFFWFLANSEANLLVWQDEGGWRTSIYLFLQQPVPGTSLLCTPSVEQRDTVTGSLPAARCWHGLRFNQEGTYEGEMLYLRHGNDKKPHKLALSLFIHRVCLRDIYGRKNLSIYLPFAKSKYLWLLCCLLSRHYSRMRRKTVSKSPLLPRRMIFLKDRSCRPTRRWMLIYRISFH